MIRREPLRVRIGALALAVAMLLSACGSSGDTSRPAPATRRAAATEAPVAQGQLGPTVAPPAGAEGDPAATPASPPATAPASGPPTAVPQSDAVVQQAKSVRTEGIGKPIPVRQPKRPALPPDLLLPDLRTLPPHSLRITVNANTGRRLLKLGNTYWNGGEGPMELRGLHDLASNRTRVAQIVRSEKGYAKELPIGEFTYHPKHNHWHFGSMALYELLALGPDGSLGEVVATSGKVTYCLLDTQHIAPSLPGTPRKEQYLKCGKRLQGMSVGWGDTYGFRLWGQWVDVTQVPDGRYALRSTADPDDTVRETNEGNNQGVTYVRIRGDQLTVLRNPRE